VLKYLSIFYDSLREGSGITYGGRGFQNKNVLVPKQGKNLYVYLFHKECRGVLV
jgi:hypothetical protein